MKKLALALAATAAFTGQALAADMAVKARPAPPPVPVASWTGCYVGGGGGYGLYYQENTGFLTGPPRILATTTTSSGGKGWFGTVGGGCDYQFGGIGPWQIVIGAFADYNFADVKGTLNLPVSPLAGQEKMTDQWSVGGRIGAVITPQLMTYVSAGYTEAKFGQVNFQTFTFGGGVIPGLNEFWDSRWYKGWFIGTGYEYALGFLPGLYWKTEYRFSEYDVATNLNRFGPNHIVFPTGQLTGFEVDSKKWTHMVSTQLVWRFNWGGPAVVSKY